MPRRRFGLSAERAVDERATVVDIADDDDEREPAVLKRDRIVPSEFGGAPREPLGFGDLTLAIATQPNPLRWR